ncbi:MAG: hypothetical protein F6K47_21430 [Symploca sp. SIO2E6]|nr:hypothetical protein [Symploca sp. SIO2E6]
MNTNTLEGKIQTSQQCLAALLHRTDKLPLPQEKFMVTMLEELFANLEELQSSIEELHCINEELTYGYLVWDAVLGGKDITEYKQTQQQLEAASLRKEILLKKVHHRLKNNFQVIYSLLQLQSSKLQNQQLVELCRDIQSRLKTLSILHQKFYNNQKITIIDLADYIQDLTNYLLLTYWQEASEVVLKLQIARVNIGIKTAIICGQIITELLLNSLKYAFPQKGQSEIFINLTYNRNKKVMITVGDNGVGLPQGIDFNNLTSLGLRLVNSLVKDIQGHSEVNRDHGTIFKISFTEKLFCSLP